MPSSFPIIELWMTMALLPLDPAPLERFTTTGDKLVTEASDIGFRLQQVFDDACDVGMAIRSHHTGKVITFVLHHEEKLDGDVVAWHLVPYPQGACKYTVVVFND